MDKALIELMNQKICQLERYNELTTKIIYEDLDNVGEILEARQDVITSMDGVSIDIRRFISEQEMDHRVELDKLMKSEEIGELSGDMLELQNKIHRAAEIRDEIVKNDKRAFTRIKRERDEAKVHLEAAAKNKQVVSYFAQTAVDVTKGSKLNVSK